MRLFRQFDLIGSPVVSVALLTALVAEALRPLRQRRRPRRSRWPVNARFGAFAAVFVRGAIVPALYGCAHFATKRNVGLMQLCPLVGPARATAGFLALDYTMYLWHRSLHGVKWLWRFHSVHHADADLDASTALRFHIGELVASLPFRCAQVVLLGVSPSVALTYEVAMQTAAVFHHSNTRLPRGLERWIGGVLVTPRMHGVHHSIVTRELQSNWSVVFSFWDRLHGTHRNTKTSPTVGLAPANDPRARSVVA